MAKILIVDDHGANREFLKVLLTYRGDEVWEAGDGAEALQLAREKRPDLVIADILMPTMDGYEFVQHLRAEPEIAHTTVMFYSAIYHESEAHKLATSCGVFHVLTKPCEPEVVLQTVEAALQARNPGAAVAVPQEFQRQHLDLVGKKLLRLADDLGEVNERLAELIEINLQLASVRNPKQLLESVCHSARKLIGASHAMLAVEDKGKLKTISFFTSGIEPQLVNLISAPSLSEGILGSVFQSRISRRGTVAEDGVSLLGLPQAYPQPHTYLAAPVVSLGHTYGWICLSERLGGGEFSAEDERLLGILTAQVGRIYENGSIYAELQEKEERFRQLADHINEVFFLIDPNGPHILYVNAGYESIWGRSRESLYQDSGSWLESVHPDDYETAASIYELMKTRAFDLTFRIIHLGEGVRWIRCRGFPIRNADGDIYRIAGLAEDITASRDTEAKIRRLNRVYAVLSGINTAIVRIRDQDALFREACRIIVDEGCCRMVWIGLLSADTGRINSQACSGDGETFIRMLDNGYGKDKTLIPLCYQAVRQLSPVVLSNIEKLDTPWKQEALARGYRSIAAFPLMVAGEVSGAISLYADEADFFDTDELKLLGELASDIGFAMEFIENEKKLSYAAYHDALTGLVNRNSMFRTLDTMLERTGNRQPFAFILLNMIGFRDINNTLGHHNGDDLLKQIATRLQHAVWEHDVVAALGGDDFAVLLPRLADTDKLNIAIRKIESSLRGTFMVSDIPISVESAMGIVLYPEHGDSTALLWQRADIALSAAKAGHQLHAFYDESIDRVDPLQLILIGELRDAIGRNELVLHYQPKVDLKTGLTVGVEALVRWKHPVRGLIFPDQFIPMVEKTGLIDPLTTWVLETALRQLAIWRKNGLPMELSANLSARNLQNRALCREILGMAQASRVPLQHLTLEITESGIMEDPLLAKEILEELSGAGLMLSLDDFGIGQSSLSYLKELPIHKLKIDKSFVIEFSNPRNAAIVRSTIELAHNLGLGVIAEGVENKEICSALKDMGCDLAQGYYFSKPLPPEEFIKWLAMRKA